MKKCIWYISKYMSPPGDGTTGVRAYWIMVELIKMGHSCVAITSDSNHLGRAPCLNSKYLREERDGIDFWWIKTFKFQAAKSLKRVISWISFEWNLFWMPKDEIEKPDAIIVSSLSLFTVLNGLVLSRRYNTKLIFEIRDIWPLTIVEEGGFSKRNPFVILLAFVEWIGYRYSDLIVGTMPNLAPHVENITQKGARVCCIPMGIDPFAIQQTKDSSKDYKDKYIPKDKFIIAYAGTIGISNALDIFLDCAKRFEGDSSVHFVLIGDGDLRDCYISKYGNAPNITFGPKIAKDQVQHVLANCDLLYLSVHRSSVWKYGQSLNKLVDYMLSGKPVIASYTGYQSMINEAFCGSFVPAGDIDALYNEILRYKKLPSLDLVDLGCRGRKWIKENRSYQKLAHDYYNEIFS